ncbi:L,D-transpeptidase family protein [Chitinophagales bacterium]|nr:L,D-transpeptidase family protein [Chitinophagales bacterium]
MNCLFLLVFSGILCPQLDAQFLRDQLNHSRVKGAKQEKEDYLRSECELYGVDFDAVVNIYIRAFKQEEILELWVQEDFGDDYILLKEYEFCMFSGKLGPKREQGDLQIPEGFYFIDHFNATSNYHLSLGINYPNPSDVVKGNRQKLGGSIYIHGACETIGCIPLTDDKIKEVYWMSVVAHARGQKRVPVHIFPYKFDQNSPKSYKMWDVNDQNVRSFWQGIEQGYYFFEQYQQPPFVVIDPDGSYYFY